MKTIPSPAAGLIGSYRTFGTEGPLYQVLKKAGENKVRIVVVETGETLQYPMDEALRDPKAR